jgi:hypothetical protein
MKSEKRKVEINEIDSGFCLFHVLFIVLPCGFSNILRVYKLEKERKKKSKMTGVKQLVICSNLFIYYEQDMAKFIMFFDYYDRVYERWYE